MTELRIGDQTIRHDREATAAVYRTLDRTFTQECGCVFCRNFAAQRDIVYPAAFRALLEQLGIDPNKEGEAFEYGPVEDGLHLYGGWFYLVGELIAPGERNSFVPSTPPDIPFDFFFTTSGPAARAFHPRLALEFTTRIKWMLEESPDSGRRPRAQ
jgi:hypothetical protein